jgi:hypothetical protein
MLAPTQSISISATVANLLLFLIMNALVNADELLLAPGRSRTTACY